MAEAHSMRIQRKLLGTLICSLIAAGLVPATSGALTIGNNLSHAPGNATCMAMAFPVTCSASQDTLNVADQASGGLVAPTAGVLTKWRLRTSGVANFRGALKVLDGDHAIVSEAPHDVPVTEGVHEFDTRLAISAGNRIGIDIYNDSTGIMATIPIIYNTAQSDSAWDFWSPALADNTTAAPVSTQNDIGLLLNADIEPDADGYGDTTQDLCATDASAHGVCPGPTPVVPSVRPVISVLDIANGNTRIYVTASAAAKLTLTFERKSAGRKSNGRCKANARSGKRCTLYTRTGSASTQVTAGINAIPFAGKLAGKKLKSGAYRLTVVATTPDGSSSAPKSAAFKIR